MAGRRDAQICLRPRHVHLRGMGFGASPTLAQAKATRTAGLATSRFAPPAPACLCPLDLSGRAAHMMVMVRKTFGTTSRACGVRQGFLLFSLCRSRPFPLPAGPRRGTAPPPGGGSRLRAPGRGSIAFRPSPHRHGQEDCPASIPAEPVLRRLRRRRHPSRSRELLRNNLTAFQWLPQEIPAVAKTRCSDCFVTNPRRKGKAVPSSGAAFSFLLELILLYRCFTRSLSSARLASLKRSRVPTR